MTKMDLQTLRHSASHIMADAVKRLYPEAKLAIGPAIEDGFYYDFDLPQAFSDSDLEKIEKEMQKIVQADLSFVRKELPLKEARKLFKDKAEPYKIELIDELKEDRATIYSHGEFVDLCKGPHVQSTGEIKYFKLLSVAGAYWRGNEKNKMLQRIYGTAFESKAALEEFLRLKEEAKKRDHRRLGAELGLFSIEEEAGPGLVFWHPKGALVRKIIEDFWKEEHLKNGYALLYTPHLARLDLWNTSGHTKFYTDYMFSPIEVEGQKYQVKPMNCPGHILIYKSQTRSYRDLPLRWAELGTVYRYEKSGVLHGLFRVRGFTQDDAHIFCRPDQLEEELIAVLKLAATFLRAMGFKEYAVYLSTQPEKSVGSQENWDKATQALKNALAHPEVNLKYEIDPGEGVFYGPKIDIKIKDLLGRAWQCSTIQVDFNIPERFQISYIDEKGNKASPIMIHRAIFGSLERFFGVLVEHYAGAFPLWLSPVQAVIINITDGQKDYCRELAKGLKEKNLRVELDLRQEKMQYKIRQAQLEKIPYMLVVGEKEKEKGLLSLRSRQKGDEGQMKLEEFVARVEREIEEKK